MTAFSRLLENPGFSVVESDPGEYIQQLKGEPPYHFVFPCMHLSREEISDLFQNKPGTAPTHDQEELTMIARRLLRQASITIFSKTAATPFSKSAANPKVSSGAASPSS